MTKLPLSQLPPNAAAVFAGRNPTVAAALGKNPPLRAAELPCVFEGPVTEACPSCAGGGRHVRACAHPAPSDPDRDTCTREYVSDKAKTCARCQDRRLPSDPDSFVARYDAAIIPAGPGAHRFNPSLIEYGGRTLMAYRTGWAGSEICLVPLDETFRPAGAPVKLDLAHAGAAYGREDPRLFVHAGALHVSFIGVVPKPPGLSYDPNFPISHTNQLYARLTPTLRVEAVYFPQIAGRRPWEKNHSYFSHDGQLYCVYGVAPHRVLAVDGERTTPLEVTPNPLPWGGGERRGGAAPVRVGDEYWSFGHDRIEVNRHRIYRTFLYTFEAAPPFRPRRQLPRPVLSANTATRPADQYASCVFCAGAVRRGDWWYLAHGVHDRWAELHRFRHAELESGLVGVRGAV